MGRFRTQSSRHDLHGFHANNTRRIEFDQDSGVYDLSLDYLLHKWTSASVSVLVNGIEVFVADLGGGGGRHRWQRDSLSIEGLELRNGDVVEIVVDRHAGPAPYLKDLDFTQVSVFDGSSLGDDLIVNGGFEDHGELPHQSRKGEWGIVPDDSVPGWFSEIVDNTVSLDFESLSAGDRVNGYYAAHGVRVSAEARRDGDRDWNDDMVFDTRNPTGGDHDLGLASLQGNVLIISEDSDSSDPDDAAAGGSIRLDFDNPTNVLSLKVIDNEEAGGKVRLYDADGHLIKTVSLPRTGNGQVRTVEIDTAGVSQMEVRLKGSGAIDDIVLGERVGGAIEIQEGKVHGAPNNPRDNAVLELDSDANARISQIVNASEAGQYRLTFDFAPRGFSGNQRAETAAFIVLINNVEVFHGSTRDRGYQPYALVVDLDAGENKITFQGDGSSDGIGALIDNVSLRQILDPAGNLPPVSDPIDAGAFAENGPDIVIDLLQNASDPDGDSLDVDAVVVTAGDGRAVPFSLDPGGTVITIARDIFDDLAASQPLDIEISYEVSDGAASVLASASLRIDGQNDQPVLNAPGSILAGLVSELPDQDPGENIDDLTANGAIAFSDVDVLDTHTATFAPRDAGYLGTFELGDPTTTAGTTQGEVAWSFTVNDAVLDSLEASDSLTQIYDVEIIDGNGGTIAQEVTVTINGAADPAPPPVPTLELSASDETSDNTTNASIVRLTGQTGPGLTVELVDGAGAVVATALSNLSGAFRFTNVSLEPGANSFSARAIDAATGLSSTSPATDFTREDPGPGAPVNAVLFWNDVALDVIASSNATPDYASRALAMESHAIFNTVAAYDGTSGFQFDTPDVPGADLDAAISHAAYSILSYLFPGQSAILDQALADSLLGITDGLSEAQTLGEAVAGQIAALRANDGWDRPVVDVGSNDVGVWRPTAPNYVQGADPQWATLTPFGLIDPAQFRPDAPPSLFSDTITTDAFANDLERVRALGDADSTVRTADQTEIARYWADGAGTDTPPGHWNDIAVDAAIGEGLGLSQSADMLLRLNLALADAAIAAWDTKYTYDFWRPITVLTTGGDIGGGTIAPEVDWAPLVVTPNHPEYVSGHSTYSGAAATILTDFFGDDYAFSSTADTVAGSISRDFTSFWDAANEAGESRIFGGIHFDFSNVTGLELGADVANWILQGFDPANDIAPPRIVVEQPVGFISGTSPVLSGFLTDNLSGVTSLQISVDDGPLQTVAVGPTGAFAFQTVLPEDGSEDGTHFVEFLARDAAGNTAFGNLEFVLASQGPAIDLSAESISDTNTDLEAGSRLVGEIDLGPGNAIASLRYSIDGGTGVPITFDRFGRFDIELDLGELAAGGHTVTLDVADRAGNTASQTINATLAEVVPLTITRLLPENLEGDVGVTSRPLIEFSRAVDVSTLTEDSLFATDSTGAKLPARIVPLADGKGAWLFFDDALPGGSAIEINVVGDLITDLAGAQLDADDDGAAGGSATARFTTVSNAPIPGTTLTGVVLDPGSDLFPMTPDDFIVSPGGATDWDGHTYLNPVAGAEVYILGRESEKVFTDADGRFTLTNVPGGNVKVVVDGRTATNAPADIYFPEMVVDVVVRPGVENTIMSGMGPMDAQIARIGNEAFYLPRVESDSLIELSDTEPTVIRPTTAAGTNLTPAQFDLISLTVQPGSLVDANGDPVVDPEIGLTIVPSPLVTDMLPEGMPVPPIFLTIQGPDGGVFTEEAVLTLPNVFGLSPGQKTEFFSYDHTTGLLVVNGYGTVSEDGLSITTDPGNGILQPGWNGAPPPVSRIGVDPNIPCPPIPGTSHQSIGLTDVANAYGEMRANFGIINNAVNQGGRFDIIDTPGPVAAAEQANNVRMGLDRFNQHVEDYYVAKYTGNTGDVGGQFDAGYKFIQGTRIVGDVAGMALNGIGAFVEGLPIFRGTSAQAASQTLSGALDVARAYEAHALGQNQFQNTINLRDRALADAQAGLADGLDGKIPPADRGRFQDVIDRTDALTTELNELDANLQDGLPFVQVLIDNLEIAQNVVENIDTIDDVEIVGPESPGGPNSEFIDAINEIVDAVIEINNRANLEAQFREIEAAMQDVIDSYNNAFGEDISSILASELLNGDPAVTGGLTYEFLYGPVFYGTLTNLETGESERFTFNPAEGYDRVVTPDTSYSMTVYDPISGQVATTSFTSVVAGAPRLQLNPLMNEDKGPVGPGGLTEFAALAVGADFTIADSLLPGTGISDRQALASGLAGSPQLINTSGVTGIAEPAGTAEAVTIGGTTGNGGGMTAFVATGDYGLAIIDVGRPNLPVIIGQVELPGFASDVAVNMDAALAAVATGAGGLSVVDFSDAANPAPLYTRADILTSQVEVIGDRIVAGSEGRIFLIDIASGTTVESIGLGVGPTQLIVALAVEGTRIYALGDNEHFYVLDAADDTLALLDSIDLSAELGGAPAHGVFGADGVAWIGGEDPATDGGLVTVDISDPPNLALISGADDNGISGGAVALNGSGFGLSAQFAGANNALDVFDASDPNNTGGLFSRFVLPGELKDVAIAAGTGFVAAGSAGLQIVNYLGFDVSGAAPSLTVTRLPGDVDGVADGLQVFEGELASFGIAVTDDVQVRNVELLVDGEVVLSRITYPWDLDIQLPTIAENDGVDTLTVDIRATDTGGNVTSSGPIELQLVANLTPFEIVGISPTDGAGVLFGESVITIEFSKPLDLDSVTTATFILADSLGGAVAPSAIQARNDGTEVQLTFAPGVLVADSYDLTIDAPNIFDRGGNALGAAPVLSEFDVIVVGGQTWISPTSGTWNDPFNWSTGEVPIAGDVVLPLDPGVTATVNEDAGTVDSVTVSGEGTFLIQTPSFGTTALRTTELTNTGNVDVNFGQLEVDATDNSGTLGISGRGTYYTTGDILNTGTIAITNSGTEFAILRTEAPLIELTGGGTVDFDDELANGRANLYGSVSLIVGGVIGERFVNVDNTIKGTGNIGLGFELENAVGGTFLAEDGDELTINTARFFNDGLVQALAGGRIIFDSDQLFDGGTFAIRAPTLINNTNGTIWADGGQIRLDDSYLVGGNLLSSSPGGSFGNVVIAGGTLDGSSAPINASANLTTFGESFLLGDISNTQFFFAGNPGTLDGGVFTVVDNGAYSITDDTVLSGGGSINLQRHATAEAAGFDTFVATEIDEELYDIDDFLIGTTGFTLTLEDQSIVGRGTIGTSYADPLLDEIEDPFFAPRLDLDILADGRIDANDASDVLNVTNVDISNLGTIEASNGGHLEIVDSIVDNQNLMWALAASIEIREDGNFAGASGFTSSGVLRASNGGEFLFGMDSTNTGLIAILDNSFASLGDSIYLDGLGTIILGDGAVLDVGFGADTDNTIDLDPFVSPTDGRVAVHESTSFSGLFSGFEDGDEIALGDIEFSNGLVASFFETASTGTLEIDDGFGGFASLTFERPIGGFGADPLDHFFFEEDIEIGGTLVTTNFIFA